VNARSSSPPLADHRRIGVDSNVLIYLLETNGALADAAAALIDRTSGTTELFLSTIGLAEVLAGPARSGDAAAFARTADALRDAGVTVRALDERTAEEAAWIRGSIGLDLVDAVHLASAREAGATVFVTNDRGIRAIPRLDVVYLDDLAAGAA
jgi:predicted nucleic acid-binding protein